jgi:hypothetical protein
MCSQELSLCRLCIVAEADPSALARVIERFHNFNVVPRRVIAEFGTNDTLHIQVDVFGLPVEQLTLIAAEIGQVPCIVSAYWHRV